MDATRLYDGTAAHTLNRNLEAKTERLLKDIGNRMKINHVDYCMFRETNPGSMERIEKLREFYSDDVRRINQDSAFSL